MTEINWNNIRPINNSREEGFEELICQLARKESIPNVKTHVRRGAPDAGLECYCELHSGEVYGWQAKYFTTSPSSSQWSQIKKSVKTAIDKHPNLEKYYVALPLDMPNAVIEGQKSMKDKWDEKVEEWKEYAENKGMDVEFVYWGSSQLIERLKKPKNAGCLRYWFNKHEFTDEWLINVIETNTKLLGKRYTPELNLDLEISKTFNGLARNKGFIEQINSHFDKLFETFRKSNRALKKDFLDVKGQETLSGFQELKKAYKEINFTGSHRVDFNALSSKCENLIDLIGKCTEQYHQKKEELTKKGQKSPNSAFRNELHRLYSLRSSLSSFINFLNSTTCRLINDPTLILPGEAGIGKSHLLADVVNKRLEKGKLSLFLLGQHFTQEVHPWIQIINNLSRLHITEDEFLGALNAKAQVQQSRILIVIDALNEGEGHKVWKNHLLEFLKSIKKYDWLGVVVSIRTSYENLIAPREIISSDIAGRIRHTGFSDHEYEATKLFFKKYGIKQATTPLLHPEFRNPLFLKLFCEGLHNRGLSEIPVGLEGITQILNFYLNTINDKLAEKHNYVKSLKLVQNIVRDFASKLAETQVPYLEIDKAYTFIYENEHAKLIDDKKLFLHDLISEGVFYKDLVWKKETEKVDTISFAYQRFGDHLVASSLISNYLSFKKPKKAFAPNGGLFELVKDRDACYQNRGILEALAIQIPEKTGFELFEVAPHAREFRVIVEVFIESLIWRKKTSILKEPGQEGFFKKVGQFFRTIFSDSIENESKKDRLKTYINEVLISRHNLGEHFWDTVLLLSSSPNHFFNATFLHRQLYELPMGERDAWWSQYIHYRYEEELPAKRIIDWAWSDQDFSHISDESLKLTGMTLAWFLTSSNRYLRDAATKALISLFKERTSVLLQVLGKFEGVNDIYVYERLIAVAYGCAIRSDNGPMLIKLSEYIYSYIFDVDEVYPHILLRDYARGIIEYTLNKGHNPSVDISKVNPPYDSKLPDTLPDDEEIEREYQYDYESENFKDYYWSQNTILSSMTTNTGKKMYGDFGRYIFQSGLRNWDVDPNGLSNYAIKRIFEMGYDVEKHGKFDRRQKSGRQSGHAERIGKKYQWISFYEVLARVADNVPLQAEWDLSGGTIISYEGTWYPYVRDIDPTLLIKNTSDLSYDEYPLNWWFNINYHNWNKSYEDWIKNDDPELPDPKNFLKVNGPDAGEWIQMEIYPKWAEEKEIGEDEWDNPRKELWYQLRSYLIKEEDFQSFVDWGKKQSFMGRWMPESTDRYELFSREYYWSKGYEFFKKPYYSGSEWRNIHDQQNGVKICDAKITTESFLWEESADCSKESTISFLKPAEVLFDGLRMNYSSKEGEFLSQDGELICFDPSVNYRSKSSLLIRCDSLVTFLAENNLRIVWTLLGEKLLTGGSSSSLRLEVNGIYFLNGENNIEGEMDSKVVKF